MDDEVERSWTVNSAKRRAQRRQQNRGKRQISSRTLMFICLILLQLVVLVCVAVILWRVQDAAAVTGQTEGQTWCKDQPCQNNGVCVEATDGRYCVCKGGWEGDSCETDVNECKTAECHHLAICENTAGSYSCQCDEGYQGDGLESCTDLDECLSSPCHEFADCVNLSGNYTCTCRPGYTGDGLGSCQGQTFCQGVTCQHDGVCSEIPNSYQCNCTAGWEGEHCELDIDECQTFPCHEFADCINLPGNYSCACKPGYTGDGVSVCKVQLCGSQENGWAVGQDVTEGGWSGGAQASVTNECNQPDSFPFPTPLCSFPYPGQAISNVSSHLGYYSWHFKRGYDSTGQGTPYTAPLTATAGRTDGAYSASGDSFFASFWFKAANSSGDGSRIAVVAGNPAGTERASNYLEVYSLPEGITVRTAESAPDYDFCAQYRNCSWSAEYHNIVTGLDLQTWHHVEMNLTAMPVDYMDQWQYRVDGTYTYTGGAYFQTARYDNNWDYVYVNRLKFQPRHANFDASFQGFFFDDIHYGVFDFNFPEVIEEYCVSFEE
ncbi:PREDICTED: protein crumbs-like [Branchiostoma belcheri]|uniref:Protein crumbs-like n=1 Tax=Branchiostoma belcheri TaxID=7741 RepID=A0A6P4Y5B5_BRABE|nr:PREDICTED: protein crumbs-like [Branchiostoma belcheri]